MSTSGARTATAPPGAGRAAWVVAARELRDLWLAGRGVALMLSFSVVLSVTSYLVASNQALNFLEQRESVTLTLQVAVAVGALLVLLGAADAVSGERERGSLETLLLSPAPRRSLVLGKAVPALSLWVGAYLVTVPYVVYLARGVGVAAAALGYGLLVGTLLAVFLSGLGLLISCLTQSNRLSLALSLFVLLALFAPTQMPSSAQGGRFGELLQRVDPFTAGLHLLGQVVTDARGFGDVGSWLVGPLLIAALVWVGVVAVAGRLSLDAGGRS